MIYHTFFFSDFNGKLLKFLAKCFLFLRMILWLLIMFAKAYLESNKDSRNLKISHVSPDIFSTPPPAAMVEKDINFTQKKD